MTYTAFKNGDALQIRFRRDGAPALTVGALRELIADMPDDAVIDCEVHVDETASLSINGD